MRFSAAIATFVLASASMASPIAQPMVIERQLCSVGLPCWMQAEVNNAVTLVNQALAACNNAVSIMQGPTNAVVSDLTTAANALLQTGSQLASDASQISADLKASLKSQANAAITTAIGDIRADVNIMTNGAPVIQGDMQSAITEVQNAIAGIEAVVGPCTS